MLPHQEQRGETTDPRHPLGVLPYLFLVVIFLLIFLSSSSFMIYNLPPILTEGSSPPLISLLIDGGVIFKTLQPHVALVIPFNTSCIVFLYFNTEDYRKIYPFKDFLKCE